MDTYLLEWMSTYLLNLPKWWFTGVPNMIKNFVTSENKTPVTTHVQCETLKLCIMTFEETL